MSSCKCENSTSYRISGEFLNYSPRERMDREIGSGAMMARIRCGECGGKVAHVGTDLLNAIGIDDGELSPGMGLSEEEVIDIQVDLA